MKSSNVKSDPASQVPADAGNMALLGHDLRAAVSDIIGGLRLIDHDAIGDTERLQLERVRASSEVLALLLEEGLTQLVDDQDLGSPRFDRVDLSRLIYDLRMRWSGRASEKGLRFSVSSATDLPQALIIDRTALERILSNILSNAFKYTDKGEIRLHLKKIENGNIRVTVTDQGPGFSADALARLFEYKGRPERSRKAGQGLGMHISKNMTRRIGGTIQVENIDGGGAMVSLELPKETWEDAPAYTPAPLPDLSGMRVLVAEDSETNQLVITRMLDRLGARHELASDGLEAMSLLRANEFDLLLIDIEMPRLNGIEVIRSLREARCRNSEIPVVAITAYVLRANRNAIYAAGADAILSKPLGGLDTFGQAIANVLNRTGHTDVGSDIAMAELAEFDKAVFDRLLNIAGPEGRQELLDRLCADLRRTERGLVSGLGNMDFAAVRSDTHVLIALAGAVGAARLQALATALNAASHRRERSEIGALGPDTLLQTDRLIHFVEREVARRGEAT
jgi:CheY-like chemotaxis protein/anti-sigma regulatory factor (Ser/Thr protein kinase)